MSTADEVNAAAVRLALVLNELYDPSGVMMYCAHPNYWLNGRSVSDAIIDRDADALNLVADRMNAVADGSIL